jgi:signal transduction histidine kinase/ligand-binding sensor domain-containing protein/CheY-like chemotaxis protein
MYSGVMYFGLLICGNRRSILRRGLLLACLAAVPVAGHNGVVALAAPLTAITIDGDLSDWPDSLRRYPIARYDFGDPPTAPDDLTATFRVGWDPATSALLLAVEVADESVVVLSGNKGWREQDGCDIYLGPQHGHNDSVVGQYAMWGDGRQVFGSLASLSRLQAATVRVQRSSQGHQYEWRIDVPDASLRPGAVLSLDVTLNDRDADGSFTWAAWGRGTLKNQFGARRGDVLLLAPPATLGVLAGEARWQDTGAPLADAMLEVRRADGSSQVTLQLGAQGRFASALPVGDWQVELLTGGVEEPLTARIDRADTTRAVVVAALPEGSVVPAGRGRRVEAGTGLRQGLWHAFGVIDGLPSPQVYAIAQDRRGHLWVGTERGVATFDGETFTIYDAADGLAGDEVLSICEDVDGNLWFGTLDDGVSRFDGTTFTNFDRDDGLVGSRVRAIMQVADGDMWLGTGSGVSRYDGRRFSSLTIEDGLVSNDISTMHQANDGSIWLGTGRLLGLVGGGGISRWDGAEFHNYTIADGLPSERILDIHEDDNANLWFATGQGVTRWDGTSFHHIGAGTPLSEGEVYAIARDLDGQLWFAMGSVWSFTGRGVARWDGQDFATFTTRDGLGGDRVLSAFADNEGYLWFGARQGGLTRYDGGRFASFSQAEGLPSDDVRDIAEDDAGNIWFATGAGASRWDGTHFTNYTKADGLADDEILSLWKAADGAIWFGTGSLSEDASGAGVSRWDGTAFTTLTSADGLADNRVIDIVGDDDGALWLATSRGLSRYRDGHFDTYTREDGLVQDRIPGLGLDGSGQLWIAGAGLTRFDGETFKTLTINDGLPWDLWDNAIADGDGNMWFGGVRGVASYVDHRFRGYTPEDGLANANVQGSFLGSDGHLWFALDGGVSRFDGEVFHSFYRRDGLPHHDIRAVLEDRHGDVWMATAAGVTRYRPLYRPLSVRIRSIVADREHAPAPSLRLPASQRYVGFQFASDRLTTRREAVAYRYRLAGHDEGWRVTSTGRAEYHELTPGEYELEVQAIDRDFNRSPPIRMNLLLETAWHNTPWKLVALISTVLLLLVPGLLTTTRYYRQRAEAERLRLRQLALYRVREQVWRMQDPDEIEQVMDTVGANLRDLGVPFHYFGVNVLSTGSATGSSVTAYTMDDAGDWAFRRHNRVFPLIQKFHREGRTVYRPDLHTDDPYSEREDLERVRAVVDVPFSHGTLAASSRLPNAFAEMDRDVLEQLATVLSEGFLRMDDLRRLRDRNEALEAEATQRQLRERRQIARYQVREEVWKMRTSADIEKVVSAVGNSLVELDIPFLFAGVHVVDASTEDEAEVYVINEQGQWHRRMRVTSARIHQLWRDGKTSYRPNIRVHDPLGEAERFTRIDCLADVPFSHGTIGISTQKADAYSPEHLQVLEELGLVLGEGFRRLDDLQELEQRHADLVREVDERIEAERQMRMAKEDAEAANLAKSVFLANMSHEIRTPMNAILGYAQILADQSLSDRQRRSVETIEESGEHLMRLINDILDISKIEAGREELNPVAFDLAHLLHALGNMFDVRCRQKGLAWQFDEELEQTPVYGDEGKLRQVLINLLANAVKFTERGSVRLAVTNPGPDQYHFAVIDTGPGVPTDRQEAIFEPFQQDTSGVILGGTGLGLAIARRHVQLMGGDLQVISADGDGAQFSFAITLPATQRTLENPDNEWRGALRLQPGSSVRVLIVDDVETNRDILAQILERVGVEFDVAASGAQALQLAAAQPPDLVLMDIRMPEMDGVEARARLVEAHGGGVMKFVAVSASVFDHERQQYLQQGFDAFIDKPLRAEQIYRCLAEQCGVRFAFADATVAEIPGWQGLRLPSAVAEKLRTALHSHSISELNRGIDALDELDEPASQLAAHLRELARTYDLRQIEQVLEGVVIV